MKHQGSSIVMPVGRYAGKRIETLPNSYLRWVVGQNFPRAIAEAAQRKLNQSNWSSDDISVSRHALDMYSLRFMHLWQRSLKGHGVKPEGLASFAARSALDAWSRGKDVSRHRHDRDGVVKELDGIRWVFAQAEHFPQYKDVVTVMHSNEDYPQSSIDKQNHIEYTGGKVERFMQTLRKKYDRCKKRIGAIVDGA